MTSGPTEPQRVRGLGTLTASQAKTLGLWVEGEPPRMLPRLFQVPLASAVGESAFMPQSREVWGLWHRVTGFRGKGFWGWVFGLQRVGVLDLNFGTCEDKLAICSFCMLLQLNTEQRFG